MRSKAAVTALARRSPDRESNPVSFSANRSMRISGIRNAAPFPGAPTRALLGHLPPGGVLEVIHADSRTFSSRQKRGGQGDRLDFGPGHDQVLGEPLPGDCIKQLFARRRAFRE